MDKNYVLTSELIYQLVNEKNYDYLKYVLGEKEKRKEELSRLEYFTLHILRDITNINKGKFHPIVPKYRAYDSFYEALKEKNYEEAYGYCKDNESSNIDYKIYYMLLEDVLIAIITFKEKNRVLKRIETISNNINKVMLGRKKYSSNKIAYIEGMLEQKCILLDEIGYKYTNEFAMLNIISMIYLCKENNLTKDYFERYSGEDMSVSEQLKICLQNGYYIDAYNLLKENASDNIKGFKKEDIMLISSLLDCLMITLDKNNDNNKGMNGSSIDKLNELLNFINQNNFGKAFKYLLDNDIEDLLGDDYIYLASILAYLQSLQYQEWGECYHSLKKIIN